MQMGQDDWDRAADGGLAKLQTVAQCHEVNDRLSRALAQTQRPIAEQQGQIAWLQKRVKLDSRTSLKPLSSNALAVFSVMPSKAPYVLHGLIGEEPQAVVVSDRHAAYAHIPAGQPQLCWTTCCATSTASPSARACPGASA